MLKQASLVEIRKARIPRAQSHIVVTMRYYPRFLKKELRDEYLCELAPDRELLHDFHAAREKVGNHNKAFDEMHYERRFALTEKGRAHLRRLAELSRTKNVYLACVCALGERCHREILLLAAKKLFHAEIGPVYQKYPVFSKRLRAGEFAKELE